MKPPLIISSGDLLQNTEHHFRVMAGPGAGKTHWLAEHVRYVVRVSRRLCFGTRVACISYTNVAVNELGSRIGDAIDQVETATIHAFLYKNVVRPYAHFLLDSSGEPLIAHHLIDGHEEHRPTYPAVKEWLESTPGKGMGTFNQAEVFSFLRTVRWTFDRTTSSWTLASTQIYKRPRYFPTTHLDTYKRAYWKHGIIDHDDVLYLAYRLLAENPQLRSSLSSRFPYLFIDEFQDTNTAQLATVRWLAQSGSVIGVIGDVEQSIYAFQGALPEEFASFELPDMRTYIIENNRRSTGRIVYFLNALRQDGLKQKAIRQTEGAAPKVYVGDGKTSLQRAASEVPEGAGIVVLARRNDELDAFRDNVETPKDDRWLQLSDIDSGRAKFFDAISRSIIYARSGMLSVAVHETLRAIRLRDELLQDPLRFNRHVSEIERRGIALSVLECVVNSYDQIVNESLLFTYRLIVKCLAEVYPGLSLTGVKTGSKFEQFASSISFGILLHTVRLSESVDTVRTMHQAKGAEFEAVFVGLTDSRVLATAINPLESSTEEQRVLYVASSRARDHLFLCVPNLLKETEELLCSAGVEVIRAEIFQRLAPDQGNFDF